jgi:hypothetical protein
LAGPIKAKATNAFAPSRPPARVTIKSEKAFWDQAKQRYVDVGFHIIDDYALYDEAPGRKGCKSQDPLPLSFVSWNQVIFRSFQAGISSNWIPPSTSHYKAISPGDFTAIWIRSAMTVRVRTALG